MKVGDRIVSLRERQGLSSNRLSKEAGVSQSYLRDVETGKSQPTIDVLEKICTALEITLAEFFAEDDCIKVAEAPCGYGDYADLPKEAVERVEELIALYRLKYKTEKEAKK
jgi:transcriptional regulator with XRE-family HTH domain